MGRTPLKAAATLLPLSVSVIAGSTVAARLIVRRPRERIVAAGLVLIGSGIALPLLAPTAAVLVGEGMAVAGIGLGLAAVATTSWAPTSTRRCAPPPPACIRHQCPARTAIGTAAVLLVAAATTGVPDATSGGR